MIVSDHATSLMHEGKHRGASTGGQNLQNLHQQQQQFLMQQNESSLFAQKQTQRLGAAEIDASVGISAKKLQNQFDHMLNQKNNQSIINGNQGGSLGISPKQVFNKQLEKVFQSFQNQDNAESAQDGGGMVSGTNIRDLINNDFVSVSVTKTGLMLPKQSQNVPIQNQQQMMAGLKFQQGKIKGLNIDEKADVEVLESKGATFGGNYENRIQLIKPPHDHSHTVKIEKLLMKAIPVTQESSLAQTNNSNQNNIMLGSLNKLQQQQKIIINNPTVLSRIADQQPIQAAIQLQNANAYRMQQAQEGSLSTVAANYSSNNQKQLQRRKLLFEYGLEKKFQNQSATTNQNTSDFIFQNNNNNKLASTNTTAQQSVNITTNVQTNSQIAGQSSDQRYGAAQVASFGALKGSSLGHYQNQLKQQLGQQNTYKDEKIGQDQPTSLQIKDVEQLQQSSVENDKSLVGPKSAQQQKDRIQLVDRLDGQNGLNNSNNQQMVQRKLLLNEVPQVQQKKQLVSQNEQQKSYTYQNPQPFQMPQRLGPQNMINQTAQNYSAQNNIQNQQLTSIQQIGLLEQLMQNLKAINIDKLDEKETEQLRLLSIQYQFHLGQFQQFQKQQILSGNFDYQETQISGQTSADNTQDFKGLQSYDQDKTNVGSSAKSSFPSTSAQNTDNQANRTNQAISTSRYTFLSDLANKISQQPQKLSNGLQNEHQLKNQNESQSFANSKFHNQKSIFQEKDINDIWQRRQSEIKQRANGDKEVLIEGTSPIKNEISNVYSSQERFVLNEKNLSEFRLKKSRQKNENVPTSGLIDQFCCPDPLQNSIVRPNHVGTGEIIYTVSDEKINKDEIQIVQQQVKRTDTSGNEIENREELKLFNQNNNQVSFQQSSVSKQNLKKEHSQGIFTGIAEQEAQDAIKKQQNIIKNTTNTGDILNNEALKQKNEIFSSQTANQKLVTNFQNQFLDLSTTNSSTVRNNNINQNPQNNVTVPLQEKGLISETDSQNDENQPLPPLPFSFHLNLPNPIPQINSTDIKMLTNAQRIQIFKHLQRREKNKFMNIQQNKFKNQEKAIQIKFTQQRFRNRQFGAPGLNGATSGGYGIGGMESGIGNKNQVGISSGGGTRVGMSRFVSVGQRVQRENQRFSQVESELATQAQFDKQMDNLRKQWASDMRAFGIFQQNELWQFSQMNEMQQKQILVCNLQQGKFQGLIEDQYEQLIQQSQQYQSQKNQNFNAKESAFNQNEAIKLPGTGLNDNQNQILNGEENTNMQNRINNQFGSALGTMKTNADGIVGGYNDNYLLQKQKSLNQQQVEGQNLAMNQQKSFRNSMNLINQLDENNKNQQEQGIPTYSNNLGNQNQQQLPSTPSRMIQSSYAKQGQASNESSMLNKEVGNSTFGSTNKQLDNDFNKNYNNLNNQEDKTININFNQLENFERDRNKTTSQPAAQTAFGVDKKDPTQIGKQALSTQLHKNSRKNLDLNQIQKRYEDSKSAFQDCLHRILCKYQNQINLTGLNAQGGQGAGNQKNKLGIENLLPSFTKNLLNKQFLQNNERNGAGAYRRRGDQKLGGAQQLGTIKNDANGKDSNGRVFQKLKIGVKDGVVELGGRKKESCSLVAPESTKSGAKRAGGKDGDGVEGANEEEGKEVIQEEVKKPRYFPPRKLPNPFESAAQEQEKFLQARKEALAKYSNISKNRYKQDESQPLKYVVRPGNNSTLIVRVLEESGRVEQRFDKNDSEVLIHPGWEPADDHYDSLFNFKWKPTSGGIKYEMISKHGLKQLVNHVKGHSSLTTKDNLFLNLKTYYESQRQSIYDYVPLTIVLDYLKDDIGDRVEQFSQILKIIDKNIEADVNTLNQKLQEMQISKEKSIKTPYKLTECCHNNQNLWLLKPTGFNRGIGIHIFQNFDQLRDIMANSYGIGRGARDKASIFQVHNHNHNPCLQQDPNAAGDKQQSLKNFSFVIQKLIEKPLLYLKRKFDIRQWVLLNSADGKVYFYSECYVRTSSKEYTDYDPNVPSDDQIFMQLTNNAIQKDGEDYGKFEEGNIISSHALFEYISQCEYNIDKLPKKELEDTFKKNIQKLIIDTVKSVKGKIIPQKHTFELLGYDFIIDQELNTVLIEVNTNPCLEESNSLLKKILPRMIDDMLNIVMDPLFSAGATDNGGYGGRQEKYKSNYQLGPEVFSVQAMGGQKEKPFQEKEKHLGYKTDENLWHHIFTMDF